MIFFSLQNSFENPDFSESTYQPSYISPNILIQHQINQPVTHMLYCKNTYHQDLLLVHYHLLNKTNHIRILSKKILKIQMFIWSLMRMKLQMMTFTKRSNLIFIINYFEKFIQLYKEKSIRFNIADSYTLIHIFFYLFVNTRETYLSFLFFIISTNMVIIW